ncbi:hypothetical protein BCR37DRAFT_388298 [Protomyces lactucae-debilis]|uniref:Uncharacterized protein n=1 Tax=Protomyces lactucae-debilis TaxID=2754530 RepID=A0A1Y2F7Q8_PROLT|nr:uncharacterized protein BCR37DRAFT_388298 [Protomyces lactucae-debilis]ORY79899.1 hypothetical protein BCR37DRAFT_388298 [Protomyces lactucae-debilis]
MSSATDSNAIVSSRETITNGHDAARKTSLYSCTVSFAMKHHCPSGTRSDCAQLCQDMLKQIRITPTIRCQNDKTVVAKVAPSAMSFEPGTLDSDSLSGSTCDCQVVLFLEYKSSTAQCQTGSLVQDVKNSLKSKFKEDTEAQNADFVEKADTCNQ